MLGLIVSFITLITFNQSDKKAIDPDFKAELEKIYNQKTVPTIQIEDYLRLNHDSLAILDAREEEEFEVSHLRKAINVGYLWFDMRDIYSIPKDKTIIIYCSVGNRAQRIGELLMRSGYKKVYNLYGGIFEWVNSGYPVYTFHGAQTSQIHGYKKHWDIWLEKGTKVL